MIDDKAAFAAIVVFAIIVLAGIFGLAGQFQETRTSGYSTAVGTVRINITGALAITLTDENMSFGNGAVGADSSYAIIESTGKATYNGSWAATNDPFILENTGNVLANITAKAADSVVAWIGGTNAAMKYNYTNNETGSCLLDSASPSNTWVTLPADPADSGCCQSLNYTDASDTLRIDLQIKIPIDAPSGYRSNSVTFTAYQTA